MLEQNENFIRSLRHSLSEMKKNKIEEENRINNYFKELHSLIEEKRQKAQERQEGQKEEGQEEKAEQVIARLL